MHVCGRDGEDGAVTNVYAPTIDFPVCGFPARMQRHDCWTRPRTSRLFSPNSQCIPSTGILMRTRFATITSFPCNLPIGSDSQDMLQIYLPHASLKPIKDPKLAPLWSLLHFSVLHNAIALTSTWQSQAKPSNPNPQSLKYTNLDLAPNILSSLLTARSQNKAL